MISDDEDGEESHDDYPSQSVASSAKRARVNGPIDEDVREHGGSIHRKV